MSGAIHAFTMPKWGLTMERGTLVAWHKQVGDAIAEGDEVCDVETEKIASGVESPVSGILRRQVVGVGVELPIGALLGVIADEGASEQDIDAAVEAALSMQQQAQEEAAPAAVVPELLQVAGRRVRHLHQDGQGVPVVLVHGFGGNLENWLLNQGELVAAGRPVAALDLPGHGQSRKDVGDGSLKELADAVQAYMDQIGAEAVHLIGHSLGAAVSAAVCRQAPDRVRSLVLLAPAGAGSPVNRAYIDGFVAASGPRDLKPVLRQLFANDGLVTRQLVDDTVKFKRLEGVKEALTSIAASALATSDALPGLADLAGTLPILVVWGAEDKVIAVPKSADLAGIEHHVLAGAGHMVQVEAASEVNRLIAAFLESCDTKTAAGH